MARENTLEYIDQYLNGKLSAQERIAFEERLLSDSELKQQLESYKLANKLLMENRLLRLKETIHKDIHSGVADKAIRENIFRKWKIGFGISVLLIGAAVSIYTFISDKTIINSSKSSSENNDSHQINSVNSDSSNSEIEIEKMESVKKKKKKDVGENIVSENSIYENNTVENPVFHRDNLDDSEPVENKGISDLVNICTGTLIMVKGKTTESCEGKQDGMLDLTISGGTAPYRCDLYQVKSKESVFKESGQTIFPQLAPAAYYVIVKDKMGCTVNSSEFIINTKICNDGIVDEFAFRPEHNEQFKFSPEENGTLVINDRAGREILNSPIHMGQEFIWEGMDTNGKMVDKGVYLFAVKYSNGNSKKGYITVY